MSPWLVLSFVVVSFTAFLPRGVYAIPPPDVIIQFSQTLISSLGLIAASLTIALTSLSTMARAWLLTWWGKTLATLIVIVIIGSGGFAFYAHQTNQALESWRTTTASELTSIWEQYIPAYQHSDETVAERNMTSPATQVTWAEFITAINHQEYIVVDIRDRLPYETGHIPGSLHIRFSELLQGQWEQLRGYEQTPIFIVCYLGTTGNLTAQFLADKGFTELYQPHNGITSVHTFDPTLPFTGESILPHEPRYRHPFTEDEATALLAGGAKLIDLRYQATSSPPTLPIYQRLFRDRLTETEVHQAIVSLPPEPDYMFLCNSGASCYAARLLFHDFDQLGRAAIGMYDARER